MGERSIVMTVSVCVFVCLSVHLRNYTTDLRHFLHTLPMAVARSYPGGVVIRYAFPVLCMTSRLHITAENRRRNKGVYSKWHDRGQHGFDTVVKVTRHGQHRIGGGVWYLRLPCLHWVVLDIEGFRRHSEQYSVVNSPLSVEDRGIAMSMCLCLSVCLSVRRRIAKLRYSTQLSKQLRTQVPSNSNSASL